MESKRKLYYQNLFLNNSTLTDELKIEFQAMSFDKINTILLIAAFAHSYDIIKYVLTSKELKKNANINTKNGEFWKLVCYKNNPQLEYLLTCPDIRPRPNFNLLYSVNFIGNMCYQKCFDIVKILVFQFGIKNPDGKKINKNNLRQIINYTKHKELDISNALEYLTFDCNLPYNAQVKKIIQNHKKFNELFEKRLFASKLDKKLINKPLSKPHKI